MADTPQQPAPSKDETKLPPSNDDEKIKVPPKANRPPLPPRAKLPQPPNRPQRRLPTLPPKRNSQKQGSPPKPSLKKESRKKLPPPPPKKMKTPRKIVLVVWVCKDKEEKVCGYMVTGESGTLFLDENLNETGERGINASLKYSQVYSGELKNMESKLSDVITIELIKKIRENQQKNLKVPEVTSKNTVPGYRRTPLPPLPTPSISQQIEEVDTLTPSISQQIEEVEKKKKPVIKEDRNIEKYNQIINSAKYMNFQDFERMKILRMDIGRDRFNRPVILFKERLFTSQQQQRLLPYVLSKLDPIASDEYVLVWCIYNKRKGRVPFNQEKNADRPGLQWLLSVYRTLSRKVRKNLKSLYLVHPTFLYSLIIKFFRPFVSKKFWRKLTMCGNIRDIEKRGELRLSNCPMPPYVVCYNIEKQKERVVHPVFGVTFQQVLRRRDQIVATDPNIPRLLVDCLEYLRTPHSVTGVEPMKYEGIFRIAANKAVLTDLQKSINFGYYVDLEHVGVHEVSGLIKIFFRQMAEPIVPYHMYTDFIEMASKINEEGFVEELKKTVEKVPKPGFDVLKKMVLFLRDVSKFKKKNRMGTSNLAILFGPNFMRSASKNRIVMLQDSSKVMAVMNSIIVHSRFIFLGEEDESEDEKEDIDVNTIEKMKKEGAEDEEEGEEVEEEDDDDEEEGEEEEEVKDSEEKKELHPLEAKMKELEEEEERKKKEEEEVEKPKEEEKEPEKKEE